ncbi:MAG: general secretion pathway protein GspF [Gammaproteobacteria bacterium]|nr:general secretion pathway protein GspF [Gammaproteobacteria bacterium]
MRPKTAEEYIYLVDQAICEIDELRSAVEYDFDSMGDAMTFLDTLERQVKDVYETMKDGSYKFENKDLPFMDLVNNKEDRILPFKYMLRVINDTHRKGLDVGDDG